MAAPSTLSSDALSGVFPRCSSIEEEHFSFACDKIATLWTFLTSWQIPVIPCPGDLTRSSLATQPEQSPECSGVPKDRPGGRRGFKEVFRCSGT